MNSVQTGIDVLIRSGFAPIRGMKVGLITNQTGITADGVPTIDVLHAATDVSLAALFGPEHGLRGQYDEAIPDDRDPSTGLPVFSLYGSTMRPLPEQLAGLDALVFDIQDIGCRFYTYISTLGNALEEAAAGGVRFVAVDRPNPITGAVLEGPLADPHRLSFTAWHRLPVRHGMTVGELARLFNAERGIGADLLVVPCEGWRRSDWFDATGLLWVNPSPNMRSLTQALLYPGIGLLETTNVSVGRGTHTPFEVVGAPWLDGRRLSERLNGRDLAGVRFVPIRFTPRSSVHQSASCGGIWLLITNRDAFRPVRTGFEVAAALRDLFSGHWDASGYLRLLANEEVYKAFLGGAEPTELEDIWQEELGVFEGLRQDYLIYA